METKLIVALDVSDHKHAAKMVDRLPQEVEWFKVGLELFIADGPAALKTLQRRGKKIFLDLKLHDIPNTVGRAVTAAANYGAGMLTLHAAGGRVMIAEAKHAAIQLGELAPKLIAVTTLTSLNQQDLGEIGITRPIAEQAQNLGRLALDSGADGLVTSAHELEVLRGEFGETPLLVSPGIRPGGQNQSDQKRVSTPAAAVKAGASFIVVGRPILEAVDPAEVASGILEEMELAGKKT